MKRLLLGVLAMLMVSLLSGCHYVTVEPGEEAVLTYKPFFGDGGMSRTPMTVGTSIHWLTTDYTIVNKKPWAVKVEFDNFSSRDNIMLDLDTTVILKTANSVTFVAGFGSDQASVFKSNLEGPFGQMVRDVVKTQPFQDMMSNPETAKNMDASVKQKLTAYMTTNGIPLQVVSVSLGRAKPTQVVLDQVNATAAQEQRQKTELATIAAENTRADAEKARALADKAYATNLGYTTEQYAEMQIANIQADACKKAQQCVIVPPGTNTVRVTGSTAR